MQGTECDVSESLPPPAKISKLEEKSAASPQPPSDGKVVNCAGSDVNCIARERAPPAGNKDEVKASEMCLLACQSLCLASEIISAVLPPTRCGRPL